MNIKEEIFEIRSCHQFTDDDNTIHNSSKQI